jgi:hypothetical protein
MCNDFTFKKFLDNLILSLFVIFIYFIIFYFYTDNPGRNFIASIVLMIFIFLLIFSYIRMCDYGPFSWMRKIKKCCKGELVTEEDNSEV